MIIGGRYGSQNTKGISYTELEYDYAVSKRIPILAFIKRDTLIFPEHFETAPENSEKLRVFKEKVCTGRTVKFIDGSTAVEALVLQSLIKAFAENPQQGWVRTPKIDNSQLLEANYKLKEENSHLKESLLEFEKINDFSTIENSGCKLYGDYGLRYGNVEKMNIRGFQKIFSWKKLFLEFGANLTSPLYVGKAMTALNNIIKEYSGMESPHVNSTCFHAIKVNFLSYGLIETIDIEGKGEFIQLTNIGLKYLKDNADELSKHH